MIEGGYNGSRFMVQMFLEVMSSSKSSNSDSKLTPSSRSHSTRGSARICIVEILLIFKSNAYHL